MYRRRKIYCTVVTPILVLLSVLCYFQSLKLLKQKVNNIQRNDLFADNCTLITAFGGQKEAGYHIPKNELFFDDSILTTALGDPKSQGYPFNHSFLYRHSPNFHWVNAGSGTFEKRIKVYNDELDQYRTQLLQQRGNSSWRNVDDILTTLFTNRDDFMDVIAQNYPDVRTLLLKWYNPCMSQKAKNWSSLNDTQNVLIKEYYNWVGSQTFCKYIRTQGFTKQNYDSNFNRTCTTNSQSLFHPSSIPVHHFYAKPVRKNFYWPNDGKLYPEFFFRKLPDYVFYIHVIEDVIITTFGDVISKNLKLVPFGCSMDIAPTVPRNFDSKTSPLYDEVFIISQYWGGGYFHKHVECMPRLTPYLDFLIKHKGILIHVMEKTGRTRDTLALLGISSDRFISGVVRANVVYLPKETRCGYAYPQTAQLFSHLLRSRLHEKFPQEERRSVIFVRRSRRRKFIDNAGVAKMVERIASKNGLRYELFQDNPPPSYEEQMKIFNRAILVVAPHGAGLANTIYSEPGTFVIESLCNPPHVNLCFLQLAVALGHRYHGLVSRKGCEGYNDVNITELETTIETYLQGI